MRQYVHESRHQSYGLILPADPRPATSKSLTVYTYQNGPQGKEKAMETTTMETLQMQTDSYYARHSC